MEITSDRACLGEVEEAVEDASPPTVEDRVFVGVPENIKKGKGTLLWALENLAKDGTGFVIAHVHCPAQMIPMMGAKFLHSMVDPKQLEDYRRRERAEADKKLDQYVLVCRRQKVSCEKIIIEMDDVARGLEVLIALHGVTKLVVGTRYAMKTKSLISKTALRLAEVAASTCKIWFTCNGHLICTREANTTIPDIKPLPASTVASKSSVTSVTSHLRSMSINYSDLKRKSHLYESYDRPTRTSVSSKDSFDEFGRRSQNSRYDLSRTYQMQEPDNETFSSPSHELENRSAKDKLNERFKEALREIACSHMSQRTFLSLDDQTYEESTKRQEAGRDKFSLHKGRDDKGSVSVYNWNKLEDSEPGGDFMSPPSVYNWNMSEDSEPGGDFMSPPSSTKSAREDVEMQESLTEINRSFIKGSDAVCIGEVDADLPSGSKVTMNPSGGTTMETPVSSSLGAMGPLLRKVDLLLTPRYPLRRSVKHAIQLLKEDLEDINDAIVEQSMVDSPNNKEKYWMHEVRELSYDVEDAIDALMLQHTAVNGKVWVRPVHGHRVCRLKIKGLPNMLKPLTRIARVTELRTLLWEASERHQRYELDVCVSNPSFLFSWRSRIPVAREVVGNLVGVDAPRNELTMWLTARVEHLKVLCIVGPAGVGKTTLAKELYREHGSQFECRAFVRMSRTPHMSRLLLGILSQIQRPKQNSDTCSLPNIIDEIRKHLQDKRYFIVIDGLWEARVWDIIKSAFPKGHNCSRIMITCEVQDAATKFCSYHCIDVFELKPLGNQDSEKLFFDTMSGFNVQCHDQLKEVSSRILRECAGLPLATIVIAGLLASQPDNLDLWHHMLQCFSSDLVNLTLDELLKGTVNFCYNVLPQDLKTCLLYLTMYPEGCTIRKVDLLKQWIAEGFITPTTEGKEGIAENYFAELVNRGMIQPEKIMHNDEVLSCTVHHIVFDLIMQKSREENFTTAVDYSQTVTEFFMKVYRLSLHFSCAQYATKLEGIRLSQIRSLSFFGLLRCLPSVAQLRLLRVLILEFWDDNDECISLNLSRISGLVLLRYLKISSHLLVELPSKIQELKFLETLEIDARVWSAPDDIVHLPGLLHLSIQEAKLPEGIGRVTSLQTLQYFDLGNNSEDNVRSLCELINLRDLHITCSTALSDAHLKRKFLALAASLPKLTNLRSLTVAPGAISMPIFVDYSSAMLYTPMFLQRLEILPPICIFSRLPEWVGKLQKLRILKIVVRVLLSSDIDVLTGLPGLAVLSLYIRQPNTQRVVFSSGALPVLKYFKYTCGALFLAFQEDALPNLERLKLRFNVHKDEMYYHMNSGIENLLNLKEIIVKIGAADGAKESDKKAAESAIESAIRKHPRFPIYMNVRRIDWVEEE